MNIFMRLRTNVWDSNVGDEWSNCNTAYVELSQYQPLTVASHWTQSQQCPKQVPVLTVAVNRRKPEWIDVKRWQRLAIAMTSFGHIVYRCSTNRNKKSSCCWESRSYCVGHFGRLKNNIWTILSNLYGRHVSYTSRNTCILLHTALEFGRSLRAQGLCRGVESSTVVFPGGHFLFTCSDTFAVWCVLYPECTMHTAQRHRGTDRRTDNIMMQIADHTACSTIG